MGNGTTAQYIFFNQGDRDHDNRPYFSSINNFSDTNNVDTKHFFVSEDGNHTFIGKNTFKNESIFNGIATFTNQTTFSGTTDFKVVPNFNNGVTIKDFVDISAIIFVNFVNRAALCCKCCGTSGTSLYPFTLLTFLRPLKLFFKVHKALPRFGNSERDGVYVRFIKKGAKGHFSVPSYPKARTVLLAFLAWLGCTF